MSHPEKIEMTHVCVCLKLVGGNGRLIDLCRNGGIVTADQIHYVPGRIGVPDRLACQIGRQRNVRPGSKNIANGCESRLVNKIHWNLNIGKVCVCGSNLLSGRDPLCCPTE